MSGPILLKNASDSYVSEANPAKNFSSVKKMNLADASASNTRYGYIYFGLPSAMRGTTIISAKIRIYNGDTGFSGSVTTTLQRLAEKFSVNRVNWNNRPAVTGGSVSVAKTSAAAKTMWEFDVTSLVQAVADGGPWYGFRLSATGSATKWFYSAQAIDDYRPVLEITWSDSPDPPDGLKPDGGRSVSVAKPTLRWNFVDHSGDTDMAAYQLRLFGSLANANANSSPTLDTTVSSSIPQVDLDDTAYGGLTLGATLWWRVRVQDGAGLWSGWSAVASFVRAAKGTLAITNPASGGSPFVNDPTPPFSWTYTGATQVAYQLIVTTPETPEAWLWSSGKVTSTDVSATPAPNVIKETGKTYRVIVRVWDSAARESVPDDPIYTETSRDFVYSFDAAVATVTGFTGTLDPNKPWITLDWVRATAPDWFLLFRDGKVVKELEPSSVLVSGTSYRYVDKDAAPRLNHTWSVAAVVNNVTSASNPSTNALVKAVTTILSETDGDRCVFLLDANVDAEMGEASEIQYLSGNVPPVVITQSLRGFEGSASGVLATNAVGISAAVQLENLLYFKKRPGMVLRLSWVDQVIQVVVRNVDYRPIALPDGSTEYSCKFDFIQVDF